MRIRRKRLALCKPVPVSPEAEPTTRASDEERDVVIARLNAAAAEGRLTFEELSDRIGAALRARMRDELARLTADLPDVPIGSARPVPAASAAVRQQRQSSIFGDVKRRGRWTVVAHSSWSSTFGNVTLDLREASVLAPEIVINARSVFGNVDLVVPEGIHVVVQARSAFGRFHQDAGDDPIPGAPRVILRGGSTFGQVRIRKERLHERLLSWLTK